MLANTITLSRLPLTFAVIAAFGRHRKLDTALIALIALIFVLDAVDGSVARRRNETSETGALLDTLVDRIIENTFWIYFTAIEMIPVWMPITVMTRGVITDNLQHRCKADTDDTSESRLRESRISRALYGLVKMLTFIGLASSTVFNVPVLRKGSFMLAIFAVVFCLMRGLPILVDTYKTTRKKQTHAKRFQPVPRRPKTRRPPEIPQKTVR